MQTVDLKVLPKQLAFLTATEREVLYSGAYGAGKSRAIAIKVAMRASHPGAVEGLCRKTLVSLKPTTLKVLLEPEGRLDPVLPLGSYDHNKSEKTIRIRGGGTIVYFGLDDQEKIGSYNLSGCGVDEAAELSEDDWRQLRGRIRLDAGIPRQLYGATNPSHSRHHLAARFGLTKNSKAAPNCRAITTCSHDNVFLPADYLADLDTFQGVAKLRYVGGVWADAAGLVYPSFNRPTFVRERTGPWQETIVAVDQGVRDPMSLLRIHVDADNHIHVAEEWRHSEKLLAEIIGKAKGWHAEHRVKAFAVDSAALWLKQELSAAGLPVPEKPVDKSLAFGIPLVQNRFVCEGDGTPRITISPTCKSLIDELENYEWDRDTDKPVDVNNHSADALRYGCVLIDGTTRPTPFRFKVF